MEGVLRRYSEHVTHESMLERNHNDMDTYLKEFDDEEAADLKKEEKALAKMKMMGEPEFKQHTGLLQKLIEDEEKLNAKPPPKMSDALLVVKVVSSGFEGKNSAEITINNEKVEIEENENGHFRGLHVAIIHPNSAEILEKRAFDTYKTSEALDATIEKYEKQDIIVVAACQDDCFTQMSKTARLWLASMGSKHIWKLQYRQSFAFIGKLPVREAGEWVGKRKFIEALSTEKGEEVAVS